MTYTSPDEAVARIEQDIAAAQQRAERAVQAQTAIATVRGTARSARGEIEVAVDAAGALQALHLTDAALADGPAALARAVMTLARRAHQDASTRTLAIAEACWGADAPAVQALRSELAARLA